MRVTVPSVQAARWPTTSEDTTFGPPRITISTSADAASASVAELVATTDANMTTTMRNVRMVLRLADWIAGLYRVEPQSRPTRAKPVVIVSRSTIGIAPSLWHAFVAYRPFHTRLERFVTPGDSSSRARWHVDRHRLERISESGARDHCGWMELRFSGSLAFTSAIPSRCMPPYVARATAPEFQPQSIGSADSPNTFVQSETEGKVGAPTCLSKQTPRRTMG